MRQSFLKQLARIDREIARVEAVVAYKKDKVMRAWYSWYNFKKDYKKALPPNVYNQTLAALARGLRQQENKYWSVGEVLIELRRKRSRVHNRMLVRTKQIPRPSKKNLTRKRMSYEEAEYNTPVVFTGKNQGGRALVICPGPSTQNLIKYKDRLREKFDVIIGLNGAILEFEELMDYHLVMDRISNWNIDLMGWFKKDYRRDLPRILNYKAIHVYPEDLNIYKCHRTLFGNNTKLREYNGFFIGRANRQGLKVGTPAIHTIHLAGILGCSEVYMIGLELKFDNDRDHYFNKEMYYRKEVAKTKPRNSSLIVEVEHNNKKILTMEYFLDSAEYLNQHTIPWCNKNGLRIFDFSGGLLSDDIQLDLDAFMEQK